MPVLHRYVGKPGYYIKASVAGQTPFTYQVRPSAARFFESLGFGDESDLSWELVKPLRIIGDLYTKEEGWNPGYVGDVPQIDEAEIEQLSLSQREQLLKYLENHTNLTAEQIAKLKPIIERLSSHSSATTASVGGHGSASSTSSSGDSNLGEEIEGISSRFVNLYGPGFMVHPEHEHCLGYLDDTVAHFLAVGPEEICFLFDSRFKTTELDFRVVYLCGYNVAHFIQVDKGCITSWRPFILPDTVKEYIPRLYLNLICEENVKPAATTVAKGLLESMDQSDQDLASQMSNSDRHRFHAQMASLWSDTVGLFYYSDYHLEDV